MKPRRVTDRSTGRRDTVTVLAAAGAAPSLTLLVSADVGRTEKPMNCPECQGVLVETREHDITIDVCSGCQGIWFDRGELEVYSRRVDGARIARAETDRFQSRSLDAWPCPRCCRNTLERGTLQGLDAGLCSDCRGVWLSSKRVEQTTLVKVAGGVFEIAFTVAADAALHAVGNLFD